jgi:hypothetical protein
MRSRFDGSRIDISAAAQAASAPETCGQTSPLPSGDLHFAPVGFDARKQRGHFAVMGEGEDHLVDHLGIASSAGYLRDHKANGR